MRPRKRPIWARASDADDPKAIMASGKRYSTTLQRPGTKTRPRMKPTFTDMASASGRARSEASAFVVRSFA
jgi:hypothetical protein